MAREKLKTKKKILKRPILMKTCKLFFVRKIRSSSKINAQNRILQKNLKSF
jgi:hypothetical protein